MAKRFFQRTYVPKNREKYVGDKLPFARSSWEVSYMEYFDNNPAILQWGSELFCIPYVSVDKKVHRYFPDFIVVYKKKDGTIGQELIEVKPYKQTHPSRSKNPKRKLAETLVYAQNIAKWTAATRWCSENGFTFRVLTEKGEVKPALQQV